jgi:hypothetical protein
MALAPCTPLATSQDLVDQLGREAVRARPVRDGQAVPKELLANLFLSAIWYTLVHSGIRLVWLR